MVKRAEVAGKNVGWKRTGQITSTPMPTPTPKEYHARHSSALARAPAPELVSIAAGGGKESARRRAQSKNPSAFRPRSMRFPYPPVASRLPAPA